MNLRITTVPLVILLAAQTPALSEDGKEEKKIFSGPQVTEKLPPLKVKGVFGKESGKDFDFVKLAAGKPTLIIFMHKLTRPSAAVTRTLMQYGGKKPSDKFFTAMVFLTPDLTDGEKRIKRARSVFTPKKNERVGISPDGQEGPGAYGLNRNMTLTILVANKGKVTANFPLVQPSVQADVMKVVKAITKVTGEKMPKLSDLFQGRYAANKGEGPSDIRSLIAPVINKQATKEEVDKAAKKVEAYVKKYPAMGRRINGIANRIIDAGRLKMYGTAPAQAYLKKWAKEFPKPRKRKAKKRKVS